MWPMSEPVTECFSTLALAPALLQGVQALGYAQMTPVQARSLPAILEGRPRYAHRDHKKFQYMGHKDRYRPSPRNYLKHKVRLCCRQYE